MVRSLDAAAHDAHVRDRLVALLAGRIEGSDQLSADKRAELRGRSREKPGLWRYLRVKPAGLLRIDRAKIAAEARLDGKTLLRTSELEVDAAEIARGYKALLEVERGWRDLNQLDRFQLHTYNTGQGTVSQRTRLTAKQSSTLEALNLPEPPRY